jgi:hypothetical protein
MKIVACVFFRLNSSLSNFDGIGVYSFGTVSLIVCINKFTVA